jgi:hypothetical protein
MLTLATVILLAPALPAQAVAFQPVVGALPSGPILNVTPVVSADRRYVRLSLTPQFIANAGFNTYSVPAAVGGGPGGPRALGGLGMGMGAGGGGQFLAGMNGIVDPALTYGLGVIPPAAGIAPNPAFVAAQQPPQATGRAAPHSKVAPKMLKGAGKARGKARHPGMSAAGTGVPAR